jgi:LacI family transcriptional regulator
MAATLAEIAQRAGVSVATASRVLNGSARGVTAEMRARVLAAASEVRYVPNAHAQALARASTAIVGVIVHDVSDPYFSEITRGIQQVASEAGRLVIICNSYRDIERELEYMRLLHAQRVEALILAGSGLDAREQSERVDAQVAAFTASGGRVALLGRHHTLGDAVLPDNTGGARAVGQLLGQLGHRHVGVIGGPPLLTSSRDRLEGLRAGLADCGVAFDDSRVAEGDFSRDGGACAARRLLAAEPRPTALVAFNDVMAVGALVALRELRLPVPEAVSVVGFDDIPLASDVTPALTTVHVPMAEMGATAVRLALEAHGSAPRAVHLPTTLVVRDSTARAAYSEEREA